MGKDLKGNPLPPGIMQRKSGIYRGRFYYKGETYTKDNADLKKLVQEMEDLRYEVKHGLKGKGDNITLDRKSTRLNSSHIPLSRMPSSA